MASYRKTALNGGLALGTSRPQDRIGSLTGSCRAAGQTPTTRSITAYNDASVTNGPLRNTSRGHRILRRGTVTRRGLRPVLPRQKRRRTDPDIGGSALCPLWPSISAVSRVEASRLCCSRPAAARTTNCEPLLSRCTRPGSITEFHVERWRHPRRRAVARSAMRAKDARSLLGLGEPSTPGRDRFSSRCTGPASILWAASQTTT